MTTLANDLRDPGQNGVVFPDDAADLAALESAAAALGFVVARARFDHDKLATLDRIAAALEFPSYFGRNWDALADCVGDLSWLAAPGYLVVLDSDREWLPGTREIVDMLVEIFGEAAAKWSERGTPFHVAVAIPANLIV